VCSTGDIRSGFDPTFRYYDGPPQKSNAPRGTVVLNADAKLAIDTESSLPNAFKITSKGTNDPRELTTTLAADTRVDMDRWIKALRKAIADSGGKVEQLSKLRDEARRLQKASSHVTNLKQLANLERDELMGLTLKVLHEICEYLDIVFDRSTDKNKKKLVDLIIAQKATFSATVDATLALRTNYSRHEMSGQI